MVTVMPMEDYILTPAQRARYDFLRLEVIRLAALKGISLNEPGMHFGPNPRGLRFLESIYPTLQSQTTLGTVGNVVISANLPHPPNVQPVTDLSIVLPPVTPAEQAVLNRSARSLAAERLRTLEQVLESRGQIPGRTEDMSLSVFTEAQEARVAARVRRNRARNEVAIAAADMDIFGTPRQMSKRNLALSRGFDEARESLRRAQVRLGTVNFIVREQRQVLAYQRSIGANSRGPATVNVPDVFRIYRPDTLTPEQRAALGAATSRTVPPGTRAEEVIPRMTTPRAFANIGMRVTADAFVNGLRRAGTFGGRVAISAGSNLARGIVAGSLAESVREGIFGVPTTGAGLVLQGVTGGPAAMLETFTTGMFAALAESDRAALAGVIRGLLRGANSERERVLLADSIRNYLNITPASRRDPNALVDYAEARARRMLASNGLTMEEEISRQFRPTPSLPVSVPGETVFQVDFARSTFRQRTNLEQLLGFVQVLPPDPGVFP